MVRCRSFGLAVTVLVACGGCGNPDAPRVSGSLEKAVVKGTVSVRGKRVTNGEVSFRAANINRPAVPAVNARIGKDGTFTAEPLIGENNVEVSCKELATRKNMVLMDNEQPVKIKPGEQTLDIEIPSKEPLVTK
jgi:hypothetical protein